MADVLVCFDGSDGATHAIAAASRILVTRSALVLTVAEPPDPWELYDPGAVLSATVSKLASNRLGLEEIARQQALSINKRGVDLAQAAGFTATGNVVTGKVADCICREAEQTGADVVAMGTRGRSRVQVAVLGSVSAAVIAHAQRPVLVIAPTKEQDGRAVEQDDRAEDRDDRPPEQDD
jgi:nucleotide-binding universal stress UspA family protein